jgi:glycosyltransferase involved in cell wall biosynthesis
MKIAINARFLLPNKLEGMGWFIHEVLRRWVAQHPEQEFIFLFDRPYDQQFIYGPNVRAEVVFPPARHPFLFYAWYEWALPRRLKQLGAHVFVSPDNFLSLRCPLPTLLVIHDIAYRHFPEQVSWLTRLYYQHFMPLYAQKAKHIATVSAYSKADIVEHLKVEPARISLSYPGANEAYGPISAAVQVQTRARYAQGQPYFIYVGSIHPRKNIPALLAAFEQFKQQTQSPMKLLLVGRMAWQTGPVAEQLAKMQYRADVLPLGYVPQEELPALVGSAFALTYVSLFEGFGIPILEGLRAQIPVICSQTSSMPEVAGEAALLVDPRSVEQIAQAMCRLWLEPSLCSSLIAKAPAQAAQFSWNQTAETLWQVLQDKVLD